MVSSGIGIIETVIVIAVLAILFTVVIPQFSKSRETSIVKSATSDIASALDKARSETLASVNSSSYGVHFQSDKVIIFKGTVFSSGDANNESISVFSPATISNVTLGGVSGTSSDVYFNRLSGTPNQTGTVTVSTTSLSKTITISGTGTVSSN